MSCLPYPSIPFSLDEEAAAKPVRRTTPPALSIVVPGAAEKTQSKRSADSGREDSEPCTADRDEQPSGGTEDTAVPQQPTAGHFSPLADLHSLILTFRRLALPLRRDEFVSEADDSSRLAEISRRLSELTKLTQIRTAVLRFVITNAPGSRTVLAECRGDEDYHNEELARLQAELDRIRGGKSTKPSLGAIGQNGQPQASQEASQQAKGTKNSKGRGKDGAEQREEQWTGDDVSWTAPWMPWISNGTALPGLYVGVPVRSSTGASAEQLRRVRSGKP
ncbi:hypothetical protein DFJ74DRAFT_768351, partial [Hyaloraphidium curvatum]